MNKSNKIENLKNNWYFPISAMAFFLNARFSVGYIIGMFIAFIITIVYSSKVPSILDVIRESSYKLRILSFLTAIGISLGARDFFITTWDLSENVRAFKQVLETRFSNYEIIVRTGSIIATIAGIFFVYFCVTLFWKDIIKIKIVSKTRVFESIKFGEGIIYIFFIVIFIIYTVIVFTETNAFYGADDVNIIYTSDSSNLVRYRVYFAITNSENDLRQPLFAVFAAPFMGIAYLFGKITNASETVMAILLNCIQIIILFSANFMLSKMLKFNSIKRIVFVLFTSCTHTHLLFTLMMEQYIVAYFWLVLCIYLISLNKQAKIAICGAGGTLLTGMILLPFMSENSPSTNLKKWLIDIMKHGMEFILLMLAFSRFVIIYELKDKFFLYVKYTGRDITIQDKLFQYFGFIRNLFVAPLNAGINDSVYEHISWQLNEAKSINYIGVIILLLVIISLILNKDKTSSRLAGFWVVFSVVLLVGLGWGTSENGLILYSLYFGWAFFVLIFQLVEKMEEKLRVKFIVPAFSILGSVVMLIYNIPGIAEMVRFAIKYYPA